MPTYNRPRHLSPADIDTAILALTTYAIPALEELAAVGRLRGDDLPQFRAALRSLKAHRGDRAIALREWRIEHPEWTATENTCSCTECGYTIQGDNPPVESVCALCYH